MQLSRTGYPPHPSVFQRHRRHHGNLTRISIDMIQPITVDHLKFLQVSIKTQSIVVDFLTKEIKKNFYCIGGTETMSYNTRVDRNITTATPVMCLCPYSPYRRHHDTDHGQPFTDPSLGTIPSNNIPRLGLVPSWTDSPKSHEKKIQHDTLRSSLRLGTHDRFCPCLKTPYLDKSWINGILTR